MGAVQSGCGCGCWVGEWVALRVSEVYPLVRWCARVHVPPLAFLPPTVVTRLEKVGLSLYQVS